MKWLTLLPVVLAVLCVGWWTTLFLLQEWVMFPIHLTPPALDHPPYANAEVLKVDIETGGWVEGWFIPAPAVSVENPGPVVIFFHGNAQLIGHQGTIVAGYHELGCSVLLVEYRGYGRSVGKPSQIGFRKDGVGFLDLLRQRPDVRADRIIYHGRSLGGAVAVDLAGHTQPAGLILESTFRSATSMATRYGLPWFLLKNPFDSDQVIPQVDKPILIFHGSDDQIIPVSHGRALRDLAKNAVYVEFPCRHNDFPGSGNEKTYWSSIRAFLTDHQIIAPVLKSRRVVNGST